MAHKNLIGGTVYDTNGGRCMVDGTGYSIKKGRTLVDGTGYDVGFGGALIEFSWRGAGYSGTYQAEEGMTWAEFVDSAYNVEVSGPAGSTGKFKITIYGLYGPDGFGVVISQTDFTRVQPSDTIIPGNAYYTDY